MSLKQEADILLLFAGIIVIGMVLAYFLSKVF
jgi:hypothetical protein